MSPKCRFFHTLFFGQFAVKLLKKIDGEVCFMKKKLLIKLLTIGSVVALLVSFAQMGVFNASAVSYSGSGTKKDPYLVETPEQLDGMRENLSAFYKLNANIDMTGFKSQDPTPRGNFARGFVPIGYIGQPFTGTFTCDVDESGNPKYSITNLSVTNNAGTIYGHKLNDAKSYSDYVKDNSHWEAALFGAADGATFTNISITKASIVNTVVGQNQMNSDYSVNPGQGTGELQAGILVGKCQNSTITNCSVQGTVSGASFMGGMFGSALSCKITECSVKADINSTALWCVGGISGSGDKSTYTRTYFDGNITANSCQAGPSLFTAGVGDATITDCYAWGTVSKGDVFAYNLDKAKKVTNSYSAGRFADGSVAYGTTDKATNSYVVSGGKSGYLPEISKEELKQKFSGLSAWDVSGDLPTLKKTVSGTSGGVSTVTGGNAASSGGIQQNGVTTVDGAEASGETTVLYNGIDVLSQLEDLPDAYNIEADEYEKYLELYKAYKNMPASARADVDEETDEVINEIGEVISQSIADEISDELKKLPKKNKLTDKNKKKLNELVEMYKMIPSEFRSLVKSSDLQKLSESLEALGMDNSAIPVSGSYGDSSLKYIIVVIIAVNILLLAGTAVFVVLLIRTFVKQRAAVEDDMKDADSDIENSNLPMEE